MVEAEVSGLDIMHGELKNLMLLGEKELERTLIVEQESGEAMDSMERTYAEGYLDALVSLYQLTYDLSFAIGDKNA
jgi:hypothetical protein